MSLAPTIVDLIEAADLNGLLRAVDGLCEGKAWEDLLELADRCDEAMVERGKQLWPISAHIDYRTALEAPPEYAGGVLDEESPRFAIGPLTEVAASTHTFEELIPFIESDRVAAYVAQERVLRGEDLTDEERSHPEIMGLPLHLEDWEPTYALATYKSNLAEIAEPWEPTAPLTTVHASPDPEVADPDLTDALLHIVQAWTSESNGVARAVAVSGHAAGAIGHLTTSSAIRIGKLEPEEALQRIAWAAASGGAQGRRRGAAFGRFTAWYTAARVVEMDWPVKPEDLGDELDELNWYRWDEGDPEEGWVLRIAIEDPEEGWAVALAATDLVEEEGEGQ